MRRIDVDVTDQVSHEKCATRHNPPRSQHPRGADPAAMTSGVSGASPTDTWRSVGLVRVGGDSCRSSGETGVMQLRSVDDLRSIYRQPGRGPVDKVIHRLDPHCAEFLAKSPFFVLSTANADGVCDASPKGGPA